MYKTVRHGENSLQYKILAQQEEGVTNIKYRKSPRTVTGKLITIIILLIIGIIASAVLVPLVLTNDFIALTGTFQKFSVSTLRRSHSGNHVVVIAKKPYGWNAPRSSAPTKPSNVLQVLSNSSKVQKSTLEMETPTTTLEPTTATTAGTTTTAQILNITTTHTPVENRQTTTTTTHTMEEKTDPQPGKSSATTTSAILRHFQTETPTGDKLPTTSDPVWFEPVKKWGLTPSDNFITGMNGVITNPVSILGSFLFVLVIVAMFFILRKSLPRRKISAEKESAETKEHKTRLLKPSSVSSDHDEE